MSANGQRPGDNVAPFPEQLVYGCGSCGAQGHRVLEDSILKCGQCGSESALCWYEPEHRHPQHEQRVPHIMDSREYGDINYVCRGCRNNKFHLHESGTITCYRCKKSITFRHWNPTDEVPEVG